MKQRSIGLMIVLTILTFGLYYVYWYVVFQSELKEKTGEGFGGLGHLFVTLISSGIYGLYWQYAAGKRLHKLGTQDYSILYLIFSFVALSWLNPFLMQNQANQIQA